METNSSARTVSFKLREPGFFKTFEGRWSITAAAPEVSLHRPTSLPLGGGGGGGDGFGTRGNPLAHMQLWMQQGSVTPACAAPARSVVHIHNMMSTQMSPPYPLSLTLKGHGIRQAKDMLKGLLEATTPLVAE
ncbi:MAG: hypothetical protein WDW36_001681 [Sanguina aurantia]